MSVSKRAQRKLATILRKLKDGRNTGIVLYQGLEPTRLSVRTARAQFRDEMFYLRWLERDLNGAFEEVEQEEKRNHGSRK